MEKIVKKQLLDSMSHVFDKAKKCHLDNKAFEKMEPDLTLLSNYLGVSNQQSFFTAIIFALNYKGDTVDVSDMIDYFECNPLKLLEFSDDINVLQQKKIINRRRSTHRVKLAMSNDQFTINERLSECIITGKPMPDFNDTECSDAVVLLEKLYDLYEQREDDSVNVVDYLDLVNELLNACESFPMVKFINQYRLDDEDKVVFCIIIWKMLNGKSSFDAERVVRSLFDTSSRKVKYLQNLLVGNNQLIKESLIEVVEAVMFNDAELKLTDQAMKQLEACGLKFFFKRPDNVIVPEKIVEKPLFFSDEESRQLEMLHHLMGDEEYRDVQERLRSKNLPTGVTVLLHGAPGTGKTETVYQLSRQCNRPIFKVDISQSKSMWFGESEKIIKRVFTDYRSFAKECELMPILLFNEADAIIGKRKDVGSSNVAQTENAIQNIILEELENFDGILFATTNLVTNIDEAFDRRFLFKIEFHKPDVQSKSKIWKSKLPDLQASECEQLARQFDLSGGQIDNVVRKMEMSRILNKETLCFGKVEGFCNLEVLHRTHTSSIGFKR